MTNFRMDLLITDQNIRHLIPMTLSIYDANHIIEIGFPRNSTKFEIGCVNLHY